jgi:hypothetical protein
MTMGITMMVMMAGDHDAGDSRHHGADGGRGYGVYM